MHIDSLGASNVIYQSWNLLPYLFSMFERLNLHIYVIYKLYASHIFFSLIRHLNPSCHWRLWSVVTQRWLHGPSGSTSHPLCDSTVLGYNCVAAIVSCLQSLCSTSMVETSSGCKTLRFKKSTVVSATEAPVSVSDPSAYTSQEGAQYVSVCNRSGSLGPKVSTCDTKEVLRPAEGPNIISANSPTGSTWSRWSTKSLFPR